MRAALLAGLLAAVWIAAPGPAVGATSQAVPVGMVDEPCLPLPPKPEAQKAFEEAFLRPGRPDLPRLLSLTQQPEVVAWQAARAAREAQDWAGLCRYRDANARLAASGERPAIVFMGDSITENWVEADPAFFSDGVVGRGVGGQTTAQMLVRFHADVIALTPRAVHIMAGSNDVAGNGGPTTEDAYRHNVMAMVEIARAHGVRVILASIPPARGFIWRPEIRPAQQIVRLNAWLRDYAAAEGLGFIDYHAALADSSGGLPPELGIDGVHPNRDGYAVMRRLAPTAADAR